MDPCSDPYTANDPKGPSTPIEAIYRKPHVSIRDIKATHTLYDGIFGPLGLCSSIISSIPCKTARSLAGKRTPL